MPWDSFDVGDVNCAFVTQRLECGESVIFVATDTDPAPASTLSLAVPQVESLTLDNSVGKEMTQSVLERALGSKGEQP